LPPAAAASGTADIDGASTRDEEFLPELHQTSPVPGRMTAAC
jgi:hypothetical protein